MDFIAETLLKQIMKKNEELQMEVKEKPFIINAYEGFRKFISEPSGPDGTRTRDLCRDRAAF